MNNKIIKLLWCTILCIFIVKVHSQEKYFSLDNIDKEQLSKWKVNKTYNESDTIKLFSNLNISCLAVTGTFILQNHESYIRIILKDNATDVEYLVSDVYFPLNALNKKHKLTGYAVETAALFNISSGIITIEINKAECEIKELSFSNLKYKKSSSLYKQEKNKHKEKQDSLIVDKIQVNLNRNNYKWIAGVNGVSKKMYSERKKILPKNDKGEIINMQGFEYYTGGIFDLNGVTPATSLKSSSAYVANFDWRDRHGKNWNTPVKYQQCEHCWVFGPVASAEALVNIHFNKLINLDLSEQDVASCSEGEAGICEGGYPQDAIEYIVNTGVVDEDCFPYQGSDRIGCYNKCGTPFESISFDDKERHSSIDEIKYAIINNGPISASFIVLEHEVAIVGWKTYPNGETSWIYKNSYGEDWGFDGYGLLNTSVSLGSKFSLSFPLSSLQYSSSDIQCLDLDGDGYYYWGLGSSSKPNTCPDCSLNEPDGDDSNPNLGPMDEYGNIQNITPHVYNARYIIGNATWSEEELLCGDLIINSTLTVKSTVTMPNHSEIVIQNGGKLIIDGGHIINGNIIVNNGCNLTIKNNGVVDVDFNDELDIKYGATFNFDLGLFNKVTY